MYVKSVDLIIKFTYVCKIGKSLYLALSKGSVFRDIITCSFILP